MVRDEGVEKPMLLRVNIDHGVCSQSGRITLVDRLFGACSEASSIEGDELSKLAPSRSQELGDLLPETNNFLLVPPDFQTCSCHFF